MKLDKTVLITGATGVLGHAVSQVMAETDARLALTGRRQQALEELAGELRLPDDRILLHPADLTKIAEVQALVDTVAARWGGVDILLNIAGGWRGGTQLATLSEDEWDAVMDMNLRSAFLINRTVLPYMLDRGWGRIVNVSSRAAERPGPRQSAYNVSKAGVVALTASIAVEYRRRGIAANAILPSIIDTPNNRKQMPDADFGRWVKPEQVARIMLFLCTEESGSLNGASIPVYGRV